jgi:outer membrane receptor protein involved in Fe transport
MTGSTIRPLVAATLGLAASLIAGAPAAAQSPVDPAAVSFGEALHAIVLPPAQIAWSSALVEEGLLVPPPPASRASLAERLDDLLAPLALAALESPPGVWTVVRRSDPAALSALVVRLTGGASDRPLPGVELRWGARRARTDADGVARFAGLPPGAGELEWRGQAGSTTERLGVRLLPGREQTLDLELPALPVMVGEIDVTPSRTELLRDERAGAFDLDREQIERLPHLGDDLLRAAARLPGAVADDYSAKLGMRGGDAREVALRIDGFAVPKPYHLPDLQNLFGLLDSSIVEGVDLYAGGFPVDLPGAQSGVLDARTRSAAGGREFELGVSFLTARAVAGGPLGRGGSWLTAARRGYLDLVLDQVDAGGTLHPSYGDLFGKLELPLGERAALAIETLAFSDRERFEGENRAEERLTGQARGASLWLRLDQEWSSRLSSRTVAGATDRMNDRSGFVHDGRSSLDETRRSDTLSLAQEWSWTLGQQVWKWGWSGERASADYEHDSVHAILDPIVTRGGPPITTSRSISLAPSGNEGSLYLADRVLLSDRLAVELGGRWLRNSWLDGSAFDPRLQVLWRLGEGTNVRAAWGRYAQAQRIDELQVEDGVETFHPIERAEHRILSWERRFARAGSLRLEAYEKLYGRPSPRFENLFDPIELFPSVEDDRIEVVPERARVRGLEASWAVRPTRRTRLDLSYVLSKAEDLLAQGWTPRRFDQPRAVTAIAGFSPRKHWNLDLVGTWHTGWPTTAVALVFAPGPDGVDVLVPELGPLRGERFPNYLRFDLRVRRSRPTAHGSFDAYVEIFNLTDRENICCVESFDLVPSTIAGQPPGLSREYDTWLPLVPSFGFVWRRQ